MDAVSIDWLKLTTDIGSFAVVVWIIWLTFSRTLPTLQREFREELREERKELQKERDVTAAGMREISRSLQHLCTVLLFHDATVRGVNPQTIGTTEDILRLLRRPNGGESKVITTDVKRTFDPDHILHDSFLTVASDFDVQAFLERLKSPLASLRISGETISAILERAAREASMDVRVLLVKLQVEQSLLTSVTPDKLDWAMGYGLSDDGPNENYRDFETQVRMAAATLAGYLKADHHYTVVGQVGQPLNVRDGLVVPRNAATAALYRYTPWIGNRPFEGRVPPYGNCLYWVVHREFFDADPRDPAESASPVRSWRLIVPPDNWTRPLEVSDEGLGVALEIATRLNMVVTRDATRRKLYLGLPTVLPPVPPPGPGHTGPTLTYPSGVSVEVVKLKDPIERERYAALADDAAPLIAADRGLELSANFRLGEFLPNDPSYRYARVSPRLIELLETLRAELGKKPLMVTSGYRPPDYNRAVEGVPNSAHLDGLAADIYADHVSTEALWAAADRLVGDRGGVGFYPDQGFVHVDVRGYRARWDG